MYYQKLSPPHQTHLVFCFVSQLKIKYNTNKKQLSLPKYCPEVVFPTPRTSSVQFYSCQTQHSPFLCKLFTFYILIFFIQNTLYTTIWSQVDWAEHEETFMLLDPLNLFFVYLTTWHFSWNTPDLSTKSIFLIENTSTNQDVMLRMFGSGLLFPTESLEGFIHIWSISDIQRMKGYSKIWKSSTREILNRK